MSRTVEIFNKYTGEVYYTSKGLVIEQLDVRYKQEELQADQLPVRVQRLFRAIKRVAEEKKLYIEWSNPVDFFKEMGTYYTPMKSLHMIDDELGYTRDNCVWLTHAQVDERIKVTYKGEEMLLSKASELCGVPLSTLRRRHIRGLTGKRLFNAASADILNKIPDRYHLIGTQPCGLRSVICSHCSEIYTIADKDILAGNFPCNCNKGASK